MDAQKKTLRAGEQDAAARDAWRAEVALIPARDLVFLDETGRHLGYTPTHAWAPRGRRAHAAVPRNPGENKTVVAALTLDGIGATSARHAARAASSRSLAVSVFFSRTANSA